MLSNLEEKGQREAEVEINQLREDQKSKRKRRCSKNDTTPRSYECGCGRGYYSYPALYTHLKLKHQGKSPDGTKIPYDKHYGTRGRPKDKKTENSDDEEQQAFHSDDKEDSIQVNGVQKKQYI